jgi:hypothetical protein
VQSDITAYTRLVRTQGGILCGHDCEGRISDYETAFLEEGRDVDFFESVHCGVVLAVGQHFDNYSVNHSIWSVKATGTTSFSPTALTYSGIADKRQSPSPPIGYSRNHIICRRGRWVYAIDRSSPSASAAQQGVDFDDRDIPRATSRKELETVLKEKISPEDEAPTLIETYGRYNIVRYWRYFAVARSLGHVDVPNISRPLLEELIGRRRIFVAETLPEIRAQVESDGMRVDEAILDRLKARYRRHLVR